MIKVLLLVVLVHAESAQLVAVQPFPSLAVCEAERERLAPTVRGTIPAGLGYVMTCVPVEVAGVDS